MPVPAARVSRMLEPIFHKFLDIQRRYLDELDAALDAGDCATLRRLGHAIKGGAATYELPDAAALGGRLEQAALDGDLGTAAAIVPLLRRYYTDISVAFVDKSS
jgi:HPt (histidine-containing phosphotransfer) domain-containing protein